MQILAKPFQLHDRGNRGEIQENVSKLLTSVDLIPAETFLYRYPHELSGGMCQRVIIAMALANSPRLILADEPTQNLDVTIQRQVLDLMARLARETGAGLLLMTRDLGIVARYCQRVAVLMNGQIIEEGPVRSFFTNPEHPHSEHLLQAAFAARGEG